MRDKGLIPPDMQAKISVMMPAANPASARIMQDLWQAGTAEQADARPQ
jgi:hypothetical protein